MNIGILGAGTLSEFIIDILRRSTGTDGVSVFDDRFPVVEQCLGVRVVGKFEDVRSDMKLVIGIGDPSLKKLQYERLVARGASFLTVVDPYSIISGSATLQEGVVVGPFSTVLSGSTVGRCTCLLSHVNVNQNVRIEPFALIGAGVVVGNEAHIGEGAHLGLGVKIGLGMAVEDWAYVKSSTP